MGLGGHPLLPPPSSALHCEGPWARVRTAARVSPPRPHTQPSAGPGEGPALAAGGGGASTLPGLQHIPLARGTLILWEGVARGGPEKGALK